jgi:hypothetical protein
VGLPNIEFYQSQGGFVLPSIAAHVAREGRRFVAKRITSSAAFLPVLSLLLESG